MMNYARKNLANELSSIFDNARNEYAKCEERDRIDQARDGAESIRKGFAYDHNRADAERVVWGAREKALAAIDKSIGTAETKLTDAPTTDEANYIVSIQQRTDYTRQEMDAALSRYKSHAAQHAIASAAKASGIVPSTYMTDTEKDLADLRDLRSSVERTYSPHDFGSMSNGMAAIKKAGYQSFADGNGQDALAAFSYLGE